MLEHGKPNPVVNAVANLVGATHEFSGTGAVVGKAREALAFAARRLRADPG